MANHKWKDTTILPQYKSQECVKCGISRSWQYGDYQCWVYVWNEYFIAANGKSNFSTKETFKRPECGEIKI